MSDAPLTQADEREWVLGWPPEGTEDRVAAVVMVPNGPVLTPIDEPLLVVPKARLVKVERERDEAKAAAKLMAAEVLRLQPPASDLEGASGE